jgi:hypothetical protein
MSYPPEQVARYTVERNGGRYRTDVPDLLSLFGRKQLTVAARQELRDALWQQGVTTEPDLLTVERSDAIVLLLVERQPDAFHQSAASQGGRGSSWRERLRPRTWKGWTAYGVASLFVLGALVGGEDESRESKPVRASADQVATAPAETGPTTADLRERRALRRERARVRQERAQLRHERAQARREQARIRRARIAARREREQERAALAAAAAASVECHASYEPCLDPNASDYDCEDGSGDGPEYTGYVTVKGTDDYGLDSDGDGVGCES